MAELVVAVPTVAALFAACLIALTKGFNAVVAEAPILVGIPVVAATAAGIVATLPTGRERI